ncbi:hypothetical protein [Cohnella zeiphila]|uniref:Uncharacterized protein n=1 Tax=Cohnella zeiphila TaxID=2761120 RepID=A0A7X0ST71_9BACL|nr:hypothetical protein [Cohnella zeiphila]MBB6735694.1 hypothetical protein [Cohnella zeiphila]
MQIIESRARLADIGGEPVRRLRCVTSLAAHSEARQSALTMQIIASRAHLADFGGESACLRCETSLAAHSEAWLRALTMQIIVSRAHLPDFDGEAMRLRYNIAPFSEGWLSDGDEKCSFIMQSYFFAARGSFAGFFIAIFPIKGIKFLKYKGNLLTL